MLKIASFLPNQQSLTSSAGATFLLQLSQLPLSFIISFFLIRWLGASSFGLYSYSLAWLGVLAVIGTLGHDKLLLRYGAIYESKSQWGHLAELRQWTERSVGMASLLTIVVASSLLVYVPIGMEQKTAVFLILFSLPFLCTIYLQKATLVTLHQVIIAQLPESLLRPLLFLLLILLLAFFWGSVSIHVVVLLQTAVIIITWLILLFLLRHYAPKPQPITHSQRKKWKASVLPLFILSVLGVLNGRLDILMLGTLGTTKDVAIYHITKQLTQPISLIVVAANLPLSARISMLYEQKQIQTLQKLLTRSARLMLLAATPLTLLLILLRQPLLMLWGATFIAGQNALIWLSLGQLINVAAGSVALVLLMTGHEQDVVRGLGIAVLLNYCLNYLLIPKWGVAGTAIATACSIAVSNILLAYFVFKQTALRTTALG